MSRSLWSRHSPVGDMSADNTQECGPLLMLTVDVNHRHLVCRNLPRQIRSPRLRVWMEAYQDSHGLDVTPYLMIAWRLPATPISGRNCPNQVISLSVYKLINLPCLELRSRMMTVKLCVEAAQQVFLRNSRSVPRSSSRKASVDEAVAWLRPKRFLHPSCQSSA